jgi:hypothetical protein
MAEDNRAARPFDPEDPDRVFWFEQLYADHQRAKERRPAILVQQEQRLTKLLQSAEGTGEAEDFGPMATAEAERLLERLGCWRRGRGCR